MCSRSKLFLTLLFASVAIAGGVRPGTIPTTTYTRSLLYPAADANDFRPLLDLGVINVMDDPYLASGDGVTDGTTELQAAVTAAGAGGTVYIPPGTYMVSAPIHLTQAITIIGDKATIKASASFVPETIDVAGGGTEDVNCLIICLSGDYRDVAGTRRYGLRLGPGLTLDCNDVADSGIYMERFIDAYVSCKIDNAFDDGMVVGLYCWGLKLDRMDIENFTDDGIVIQEANNGVNISNPHIWGNTKTGGNGILLDTANNSVGIEIHGGYIEKVDNGLYLGTRTGPVLAEGIDFEVITNSVLYAVGDLTSPANRLIGPIRLDNCLLSVTNGPVVYADRARVTVTDCWFSTADVNDFETVGSTTHVYIHALNNEYANGEAQIDPDSSGVYVDYLYKSKRYRDDYLANGGTTYEGVEVRQFPYGTKDADLQGGELNFLWSYQGGGTERYLSKSEWWISEYRHATDPGNLYKVIGVWLDNTSGQAVFAPMVDGTHTLGESSYRWTKGYIDGVIADVNNVTADVATFAGSTYYIIDSSTEAISGSLADGSDVGEIVQFSCKVAGNNIDISVSHHVTSDPEVIRLDAAKEWVTLLWDGTDWVEADGNGQTYP